MNDYYKNLIKKVVAVDTETKDGRAFLISIFNEKIQKIFEIKNKNDIKKFFQFLKNEKINIIFTYNMDFDFLAILKNILDLKNLQKLYIKKRIKFKNFKIIYIKSKIGKINNFYFYDLAQFFNRLSLNTISEKLFNEKKLELKINKEKIYDYYLKEKYREKIKKYCLKDAELCFKLIQFLFTALTKINLNINKFYSIGYLAYEYLKMKKIKIENLNYEVEKYLNNFVRGGWVEVIQRGFFEKVYYYDVNSFYPFQISKLKDLSGAIFNFSKKIDDKSDYCYIECILSLKDDIDYSFLGFKDKDGVMKYGILKNVKYYLTKKEYETLKKYRMIEKIKILKVLNVYLREKKYLFREIINELYKNRRKNDEFLSYISKIIMNSVYGKFLESKKEFINFSFIDYLNNIDEDFKVNCYKHKFFRKDCVECRELNKIKNEIEKKEKINRIYFTSDNELMKSIDIGYGRLRNILYAIEVLANSRIYLFEILKNNFKVDDIIAVFTDGFFVKKRIKNKKLLGEKMGQLKERKYKKLLMVGCGIYQADNNLKTRGYNIKIDLFKEFKKNKNKKIIKLKSKELISLGRSIFTSKYNEDDINKIKNILKEFDINFDKKRKFSEWTCKDFITKNEKGKILIFGLDKKFKKSVK